MLTCQAVQPIGASIGIAVSVAVKEQRRQRPVLTAPALTG
jgi:hypothetical protein